MHNRRRFALAVATQLWLGGAECLSAESQPVSPNGNSASIFTPYQFGAKGDGNSDDTAAVQQAADAAAHSGGSLEFPPGNFLISKYIRIKNGVARITGQGGTIRCAAIREECGLLLAGKRGGQQENVTNCVISDLNIDCLNSTKFPTNGIWAQNPTQLTITNNNIFNVKRGYGILIRSYANGGGAASNCVIAGNKVLARTDEAAGHRQSDAIVCDAEELQQGGFSNNRDQWKALHSVGAAPAAPVDCQISGNSIVGGYYGVSVNGAVRVKVDNNDIRLTVRGISCQNGAKNCLLERNKINECLSAGIHVAYGSSDITVSENEIRTKRGNLEALLQAYVGVKRVHFIHNSVEGTGTSQYLAYAGVEADDIVFLRNELSGTPSRAYLAVESGWRPTSLDPEHYGFLKGPIAGGFNHAGMRGVRIEDNKIQGNSTRSPIYIGQIDAVPLENVTVTGNTLPRGSRVRVVTETPGMLRALTMKDNTNS